MATPEQVAKLTYREKTFTVTTQADGKGYTVSYEGLVLRRNLPDVQKCVSAARNFIDRFTGLPPKAPARPKK